MTTAAQLAYELADLERKIQAAKLPPERRTPRAKQTFARLLAAYKRRKQKLRALEEQA